MRDFINKLLNYRTKFKLNKKTFLLVASILTLTMLLLVININMVKHMYIRNLIDKKTEILLIIVSVLFILFSNSSTIVYVKLNKRNNKLELQQKYIELLDNELLNLRRQKHNYDNFLASLYGYVKLEKYNGMEIEIKNYLNSGSEKNEVK